MELYRTSDIYFAAFLIADGFVLHSTEKQKEPDKKSKVVFVFDTNGQDMQQIKTDFFSGKSMVNAKRYIENIRNLKSLCFM